MRFGILRRLGFGRSENWSPDQGASKARQGIPKHRTGRSSEAIIARPSKVGPSPRGADPGHGVSRSELAQHQLAKLIGVTCQQQHKYEQGSNRISAGRLFAIERALNVDGTPHLPVGSAIGR